MSNPGAGGNGNFQLWKGLERSGKPAAHGRVITALGRALAPTARNSDYPTASQHWSDPGNVQEAHTDPDLAQDPGPRWFLLLWSSNPWVFFISGVDKSRSVCALHAPFPAHSTRGWGLENTTSSSTKLISGLIWVWALFVVVVSLVKPPLFGCTA